MCLYTISSAIKHQKASSTWTLPETLGAHRQPWEPTHGQRDRGRPKLTYVDLLKSDAGAVTTSELEALMNDRTLYGEQLQIFDCGRGSK